MVVPACVTVILLAFTRPAISLYRGTELALLGFLAFWINQPVFTWFLLIMAATEFIRTGLTYSKNNNALCPISTNYQYWAVAAAFISCLVAGTYSINSIWYKTGLETRRLVTQTARKFSRYPKGAQVTIDIIGLRIEEHRLFHATAYLVAHRPDLRLTVRNDTTTTGKSEIRMAYTTEKRHE